MPRTLVDVPRCQIEHLSILDADGNLDAALEPALTPPDLLRLYRAMVLGRRLDERMVRLQRQGRIGTFAPIKGQEAAQMGSVFALRDTDWMVPSFRETAAMIWRGWSIEKVLYLFSGRLEGGQPEPDQHDLPVCIPVATQMPHAVGLAYAAQYRGDDADALKKSMDGMIAVRRRDQKTHSGVWRDLAIRKRRTEVDAHYPPILAIARNYGLHAPILTRMVEMIHEIEEGKRPLTGDNLVELAELIPASQAAWLEAKAKVRT